MTTTRTSLLALTCALLLGACTLFGTGGDGGPEVPEGWTTTTGPGFTVSHPENWAVETTEGGSRLDLVGPEGRLDSRVIVSATAQRTTDVPAEELLDALVAELEFTGSNIIELTRDTETEPWSPTNAADGAQLQISYLQQLDGDEIEVTERIALAMGEGVEVQVRAVDRADRFDEVEAQLRRIMSTLVLTGQ